MKHSILNAADRNLLMSLHEFIYLDVDSIYRYIYNHYKSEQGSRNRLNYLQAAGYVKTFSGVWIPGGGDKKTGNIYTLTSTGVALIEEFQGYKKWNSRWSRELQIWYRHSLLLARSVMEYKRQAPEYSLNVKDYVQEPRASFEFGANKDEVIRPDGFLLLGNEDDNETNNGFFLEMERSFTRKLTVQTKLQRYEKFLLHQNAKERYQVETGLEEFVSEGYWRVLFIAEDEASLKSMIRTIAKLKPLPGEGPNALRPGIPIPVTLTSLNRIEEDAFAEIYHHLDEEDYWTPTNL